MRPPRIASTFRRLFNQTNLLGSYSTTAWLLQINCPYAATPDELAAQDRATLWHEFGHLLHSFTTYAGLLDLRFWAHSLVILESKKSPNETDEQFVTRQARELLAIHRNKQVLAIDDFYYFELNPTIAAEASQRPTDWAWGETTGALFKTDGTLSERRFWALRFYLNNYSPPRTFIRIPMGLHTLLEHLAMGVDFASEALTGDEEQRTKHLQNAYAAAYDPNQLHYFALTHRIAAALGRLYSPTERQNTFMVSAQVVSVLADIPFDDPAVWHTLRQYAEHQYPDMAKHMDHPHPSFVFPLLAHAFEQAAIPMSQLEDWTAAEQTADQLLAQLSLPNMQTLLKKRDALSAEVETLLMEGDPSGERARLLSWLRAYEKDLSRAEKYLAPATRLGGSIPVPVLFSDGNYWEGAALPMAESQRLVAHEARYHDLLRFPAYRDIVS